MMKTRSFARPASARPHSSSSRPAHAPSSRPHSAPARHAPHSSVASSRPAYAGSKPAFSPRPHAGKGSRPFSGPRPAFKGRGSFGAPKRNSNFGGGKKRFGGERIDASRFIKKAVKVEEKPYVSKHTFSDFPFDPIIQKNIAKKGYIHPRPIQDQSIPSVLAGKDVFGMANTGQGKTAAFLLPLINKVMKNREEKVLVLAPTRELAMQIEEDLRSMATGSKLFGVCVVGGMPIDKQIREIKHGVSFVIGTPGRVTDLIKRKVLDLAPYKSVVLDEADRMLDMGFRDDMVFILGKMDKDRQTLFFSATLSPEIKKLTSDFLKDPVFISVTTGETSKNIDQDVVRYRTKEERFNKLVEVLKNDGSDKVLIFREMKHACDTITKELSDAGFKVGCIHGDKRSRDRIRTLDLFKQDKINILVATDVAARGLDIPDVTHVINYDIPQTYDTYVHRIGRTGRADKKGNALTFVPQ